MDMANPETTRPLIFGHQHAVSAGHPLAAAAAMRILTAGGNAIDAGVAAGFALNVLQPDMAALGGVAPIILRSANTGRVTTFAGIGPWPKGARLEHLKSLGVDRIPPVPHRWVVPAAVGAWLTALERYGTMQAEEILVPAIELAERGIPANYFLRFNVDAAREVIEQFPEPREDFLPGGRLPAIGEPVRQPALANTLRLLADAERGAVSRVDGIRAARDTFYKGEIAERIDAFSRQIGGALRREDLHAFAVPEVEALHVSYRGREVHGCGPWCQGPAVLQMLKILDGYSIATMEEADRLHVLVEAVKLALTDRNRYYGDPDVIDVPLKHLLSTAHAESQRQRIRPDCPTPLERTDVDGVPSPDTTYVCVVDSAGNAFSATPSDGTLLTGPHVPGLGFGVSDRGHQTSLDPHNPNVFAPGKRPRLTPNPGLVIGDDCVMPYGTPGGEVQTQAMLQFLVNHFDLGLDLQAAVEAPRFASYSVSATESPHMASLDLLRIESRVSAATRDDLASRGHRVEEWPAYSALAGAVCAVRLDTTRGVIAAGADPRRLAYAMAW